MDHESGALGGGPVGDGWMRRRHEPRVAGFGVDDRHGTYSGVYIVPDAAGPHFVAVDLLTEGTLYDDVAEYDGNGWGVTYRVE